MSALAHIQFSFRFQRTTTSKNPQLQNGLVFGFWVTARDGRDSPLKYTTHGEALAVAWNSIPEEDLFYIDTNLTAEGWGRIRLIANKPIPEEFSLLLGEMLYQLRSALDSSIYQAAVYSTGQDPPPNEQSLEFPICLLDENEFKKQAKRRLSALPQDLQDAIMLVQPYHVRSLPPEEEMKSINRSLGLLNELARKDRHRRLHAIGSWAFDIDPLFRLPDGVTMTDLKLMRSGNLEFENHLATFQLTGFRRGMDVQINPNVKTTIGLNEPPPPLPRERHFWKPADGNGQRCWLHHRRI